MTWKTISRKSPPDSNRSSTRFDYGSLALPGDEAALKEFLVDRGRRHFPQLSGDVLKMAATLLYKDRKQARDNHHYPLPGQAEYLDLLRAVTVLNPDNPVGQENTLRKIAPYGLKKHPDAQRGP